jgi:ABC-type polysaccharide/polyol phosphate transport system ATPase subunit
MAHITLEDVHLTFTLRNRAGSSLKDWVLQKLTGREPPPCEQVHALRGVSLHVEDGERVAVLGHNGAGKSALLRLMAGVYRPSAGVRAVEGRIGSLFDLMLGFEAEATGWENIRYRGYLQRDTPAGIRAKMQQIADFTELGTALDRPVRHYSSGMIVRLAFAIATSIEPEILLIDEVLAAGDLGFMAKARQRLDELTGRVRLMVVVSHDLESLQRLCARAVWLESGQVRLDGPTDEVVAAYRGFTTRSPRSPREMPRHVNNVPIPAETAAP